MLATEHLVLRPSQVLRHYPFVELRPHPLRGITLRLLEWRAGRLRDPVARLQFLQGKRSGPPGTRLTSGLRHLPAPAITLGLALAGAAIMHPWAPSPTRHSANTTPSSTLLASPSPKASSLPRVWLVETTKQSDLYSNGLRVENQFAVATAPRNYFAYSRAGSEARSGEWRSQPAGIVFHTTESHLAPFEEQQNGALRREGEGLLEYVRRQRAYHFVIDRFGRVFRVTQEAGYANHAGNSIWADDDWIYINLNQSFLGVAFEARSSPDGRDLPINAAQTHAGRILVEMLRARYSIPASNCVTHAQVSVNPGNGRAGYHTDWAANLPFDELGLSDNYLRPLPSVALFGFEADAALRQAGGASFQQGVDAAEASIREQAAARKLPVEKYRRALLERYHRAISNNSGTLQPQTLPGIARGAGN